MTAPIREGYHRTGILRTKINMTTAFTIFAKNNKRITFDICIDPFYSEKHMKYLKKVVEEIKSEKSEPLSGCSEKII